MATLTLTTQGEVTFGEDVLRHMGVRPGGRVTVDLLPEGRAELRAEPDPKPKGSWNDLIGFLDGKTNGVRLPIDEINEAIAEAGAAAGLGES